MNHLSKRLSETNVGIAGNVWFVLRLGEVPAEQKEGLRKNLYWYGFMGRLWV